MKGLVMILDKHEVVVDRDHSEGLDMSYKTDNEIKTGFNAIKG